ncbi:sugar phosphate isomerase/epimerase [Nitrosopumilus sp.]|nr:sugar phosphate isomerase/epimerase [Nitrosopumilus sp.]
MNNKIGIMCGRLSPPINNNIQQFSFNSWKNEFKKANELGFDSIEWIYDLNSNNPILNNLDELKIFSVKNDIKIDSVCADYFMEKKLFNVSQHDLNLNLKKLNQLIENCNKLNIEILEIPLVDSSSIQNEKFRNEFISNLTSSLSFAEQNQVFLTLETDLSPESFKKLVLDFDHPNIKINYDIGNSISLGYDPSLELSTLSEWIKNIHIKDRLYHSNTVPLGTGDVDFDLFFSNLSKIHYTKSLIIQGAREDLENNQISPEQTCSKYLNFVKHYVSKYLVE